jgi:hypothetical protein
MRYYGMLYGWARWATDNDIIWHMHCTCWITMATNIHWEYAVILALPVTNVTWKQTNVTFYVYCLSCCYTAGIISLYWSYSGIQSLTKNVFSNKGIWMLTSEDGMRNFLSCSLSNDSLQWNHQQPPPPIFLNKAVQWWYNTESWVWRMAWLILTWAISSIPRQATHSTITSTTNPTLHVLGSNMNLHSEKPATNCLRYGTVCPSLQCLILRWGNVSGTYRLSYIFRKQCKINVKSQVQ